MPKFIFLISLVLLFSVPSFSKAEGDKFTECKLPFDQGPGSMIGRWSRLPVPIIFDREFYLKDEGKYAKQLERAVNTWNKWGARKGKKIFTIVNRGAGARIPELSSCSPSDYTRTYANAVGVWKIGKEGVRANRRESCGTQLKLLPDGVQGKVDWIVSQGRITRASVLLNFDQFNTAGGIVIDVESLLLHQLGHVLGLLHSCNASIEGEDDPSTAPACELAPEPYLHAVMHPFLTPRELKRALDQNDYDRINCLY